MATVTNSIFNETIFNQKKQPSGDNFLLFLQSLSNSAIFLGQTILLLKILCRLSTQKNIKKKLLHWTSTSQAMDVEAANTYMAIHRYSPLSDAAALVMVSCLLSADEMILELLRMRDPSLVHIIIGSGFPIALQYMVRLPPSFVMTFWG